MKIEAPFFTVPKAAHDAILGKVEGTNVAFCVSVFVALRRLANDRRTPDGPVALTINAIARAAGCGYRKAFDVIKVLEAIGVIGIERQRIGGTDAHAPSLYTLCTIDRTLCTDRASIRAEIIQKEGKEQREWVGASAPRAPRFIPPNLADWIAYANQIGWAQEDATSAFDHYVSVGWRVARSPMRDWQAAARNCHRRSLDKRGPGAVTEPVRLGSNIKI